MIDKHFTARQMPPSVCRHTAMRNCACGMRDRSAAWCDATPGSRGEARLRAVLTSVVGACHNDEDRLVIGEQEAAEAGCASEIVRRCWVPPHEHGSFLPTFGSVSRW